MQIPNIIIAVDGYSATGKSTFAKLVASEFSFLYLDSGALYRGVTLYAQEHGLIAEDNTIDEAALREALRDLDLHFGDYGGGSGLYLGERCVETEIRTLRVSSQVSPVSAVGFVREFVDDKLHEFGSRKRVVMDGRDIGTTVFPGAEVKIFITATPEVRAQRRFEELRARGEKPVLDEVMKNLMERDYFDSHREVSPLKRSEAAFVLDNSDMTLKEEIVWIRGLVQGKFGILE